MLKGFQSWSLCTQKRKGNSEPPLRTGLSPALEYRMGSPCTLAGCLGAVTCHLTKEKDVSLLSSSDKLSEMLSDCDINPLRKPWRESRAKP